MNDLKNKLPLKIFNLVLSFAYVLDYKYYQLLNYNSKMFDLENQLTLAET